MAAGAPSASRGAVARDGGRVAAGGYHSPSRSLYEQTWGSRIGTREEGNDAAGAVVTGDEFEVRAGSRSERPSQRETDDQSERGTS